MEKSKDLGKVTFRFDAGAWHGHQTERMWAERVGNNRYRLRNSPFFAKGVSCEDVVFVNPDSDGELIFAGVSLRGGHSTYRIIPKVDIKTAEFLRYWVPLERLTCTFESSAQLLAVDVPPRVDIYEAYSLLQQGEDAGIWEFEEGHCGHPLKRRGS